MKGTKGMTSEVRRKIAAMCSSTADADLMAKVVVALLQMLGINAGSHAAADIYVDSYHMHTKQRKARKATFKRARWAIFFVVDMFIRGVNIPEVDTVIVFDTSTTGMVSLDQMRARAGRWVLGKINMDFILLVAGGFIDCVKAMDHNVQMVTKIAGISRSSQAMIARMAALSDEPMRLFGRPSGGPGSESSGDDPVFVKLTRAELLRIVGAGLERVVAVPLEVVDMDHIVATVVGRQDGQDDDEVEMLARSALAAALVERSS